MQVLVIEDNPLTQAALLDIVRRLGHEAVAPPPRLETVRLQVEKSPPDIALVDIDLGEEDGIVIAAQLKDEFKLPIVFVTSHDDADTVRRAATVKPNGYLLKPFSDSEVYASIEIALANHVDELVVDPQLKALAAGRKGGFDEAELREILAWLERSFASDITVEEIARRFGYTRTQFSVIFKATMACTVHGYIVRLRMAEARRLLLGTSWTTATIAERVGYRKVRHFSKTFERECGSTPSQFRRQRVIDVERTGQLGSDRGSADGVTPYSRTSKMLD